MASDQSAGCIDLPLAIECAEQSRADFLNAVRKVVKGIAVFAGQPRWRHVEIAGKIDRDRPMKHSAR